MLRCNRFGLLAVATAAALAGRTPSAMAQFKDQLVQTPKLASPERGSV
jgi:hypothetical protein